MTLRGITSYVPCPECGDLVKIFPEGCYCMNEECERARIPFQEMEDIEARLERLANSTHVMHSGGDPS